MNLQLGCFDNPVHGWINTDITPHIWIARIPGAALLIHALGKMTDERYQEHQQGVFRSVRYLDVSTGFPFHDGSVSAIYTSHMLEHLYPWVAERCLKECFRTLQPGGIMRVAVPDLDEIVKNFSQSDPSTFLGDIYEYGHGSAKNSHHWHYNFYSLNRLLASVGFQSVTRCTYRQGQCPDLPVIETRPESLFVEARR